MSRTELPLVACATTEPRFARRIEEAANFIGKDFVSAIRVADAVGECQDRSSSCIVVDYDTAFESVASLRAQKTIRERSILIAVPPGNMQAAFHAAGAGATGMFEDLVSPGEVANCLKAAFLSDSEAKKTGRFEHAIYENLKVREKAILTHLLAGEPNKRVASILDIGLRTVEAGRAELMKKLGVNSFAELVAFVTEVEHERFLTRRKIYQSIIMESNSLQLR